MFDSDVPKSSKALILLVSTGRRSTTITSPSWLMVLPPVSVTIVALPDLPLRKVIAEASREEVATISLNVSVAVLLLRLSSKPSRSGLRISSINMLTYLAWFVGTGMATLLDISLAKLSARANQQLLMSEQRDL